MVKKNEMRVNLGVWYDPFTWFPEFTIIYPPPPEAAATIASVRPWILQPPPPEAAATIAKVATEVAPKKFISIDWKKVAPYAIGLGFVITTLLLLRRKR